MSGEVVKLSADAHQVLERMLGLHLAPERHGMSNGWVSHSGSRVMPELVAAGFVYEGQPQGLCPYFHATLEGMTHMNMSDEAKRRAISKMGPARGSEGVVL